MAGLEWLPIFAFGSLNQHAQRERAGQGVHAGKHSDHGCAFGLRSEQEIDAHSHFDFLRASSRLPAPNSKVNFETDLGNEKETDSVKALRLPNSCSIGGGLKIATAKLPRTSIAAQI
ncbi:MAG: hypothetical protein ACI87E_002751 [Mariniblastus sp.]